MTKQNEPIKRRFTLVISVASDARSFDVQSHDTIIADNLVSLLSQFNVVIGSIHQRIVKEEQLQHVCDYTDEDIPF